MDSHSDNEQSDDDDETVPAALKKQKLIHYGSLANAERERLEREDAASSSSGPEAAASKSAIPGLDLLPSAAEYMELDETVDSTKEQILAEFERRRKARAIALPTDDNEVRELLRKLNEAVCLFGEGKPERRERLRSLVSLLSDGEKQEFLAEYAKRQEEKYARPAPMEPERAFVVTEEGVLTEVVKRDEESTWYHEGPDALRKSRIFIAKYSLPRAKARLDAARRDAEVPHQQKNIKLQEMHRWIRDITNCSSQIGDTRPISWCEFSPNSQMIATASWSGLCKLWSVPELKALKTFRGHKAQVGCVTFHPQATIGVGSHGLNLASCCHEGAIKLWTLDDEEPVDEIEGHAPFRVSRVAFHPSGRFIASCCYDHSWRLFDIEENEEVLFQEGHSKPVYDIAFQRDGSMAVTGGLDSYARAWDLRTGRCVMFLEGHLQGIMTVAFSPNGFSMATGSQDNSCKLWDLRMRRCVYTIPAHQGLVARMKFEQAHGDCLVTCSYDKTVKLWANPGWHPLKTLRGHDNKVMCVDISPDSKWVVSSSFDRTFKLWAPEEVLTKA